MPCVGCPSAVGVEADCGTIAVGRQVAIDRWRERKYTGIRAVEASAFRVDLAWSHAQGSKDCILERLRGVDVVGADHNMTEHEGISSKISRRLMLRA